ncbi:MAG: hypothetical protein K2I10_02970 [Lachnospiraceae bacterium]|nr:hypothetical protein [Lachnospiraceae bacterium]
MAKIGRPIGPGKPVMYRVYKHGRYVGIYEKEELKERFGIPLKGLKGKIKVGTIFTGGFTVDADDVTLHKRKDLIMAYYLRIGDIETMTLEVRKGIPDAADPLEPVCLGGNILNGDRQSEMPLYLVELDGVNVVSVTPKFRVLNTVDNTYPKEKIYTKGETYSKEETDHLISIETRDINFRFEAFKLNLSEAERKIDGFSKRFDTIEQKLMTLEGRIRDLEI